MSYYFHTTLQLHTLPVHYVKQLFKPSQTTQ